MKIKDFFRRLITHRSTLKQRKGVIRRRKWTHETQWEAKRYMSKTLFKLQYERRLYEIGSNVGEEREARKHKMDTPFQITSYSGSGCSHQLTQILLSSVSRRGTWYGGIYRLWTSGVGILSLPLSRAIPLGAFNHFMPPHPHPHVYSGQDTSACCV